MTGRSRHAARLGSGTGAAATGKKAVEASGSPLEEGQECQASEQMDADGVIDGQDELRPLARTAAVNANGYQEYLCGDSARTRKKAGLACLLAIFSLAAFLRTYRLDDVPTGLYIDEVAMSVEARSLGQTLRDVDGNFLPLFPSAQFSSAWGYGGMVYQPIYVYSKIPFEFLLRSGGAAVRLPSVVWGLVGIATSTVLAWTLSANLHPLARWTATLLTPLLLAISPWHHHFSRLGFEVISCPVFITVGATLLIRSAQADINRENSAQARVSGTFVAGVATVALSAYAYHTARLFAPLLVLAFCLCFRPVSGGMRNRLKPVAAALVVLVVVMSPLVTHELSRYNAKDSKPMSEWFRRNFIFTTNLEYLIRTSPVLRYMAERCSDPDRPCWTADYVLRNQHAAAAFVLVHNYLSYLSPSFLFWRKDANRRHSASGSGVLLVPEFVLLVVGVLRIGRQMRPTATAGSANGAFDERPQRRPAYDVALSRFLLLWLVLWPLPASLCVQTPHAVRSFVGVPILELVMAYGAAHAAHERLLRTGVERSKVVLGGGAIRRALRALLALFHRALPSAGFASVVYASWLVYAAAAYQHRFFSHYSSESLKSFNLEVAAASFTDLKEARYFNKSRVLVGPRVDNSFVYILYAEEIDYRCLHRNRTAGTLNEKLRRCKLPYEIVFNSSEHTMRYSDLLLLDVQSLKSLPDEMHRRFEMVKHWYNYHGVVRLKPERPDQLTPDLVDDEDEF